ncbi:Alpha-galactosidase C [Vanrija pseudolonga]|uniref:Alpha-galactosidase n=1 Tax=Vanrija pseudolonga TaxID=143232 RepID=A0AAF0YD60_9TREE|nr:Alpha-galactosidase C [Vanrija pseudolonga]
MKTPPPVEVNDKTFILNAPGLTYIFHVDDKGDLKLDHYGAPTPRARKTDPDTDCWMPDGIRREFPDAGRGDMRLPVLHLMHNAGHTVSRFVYERHEVLPGKPSLEGLPSTFGGADDVTTLRVQLVDLRSGVQVVLSYSVFHRLPVITRSYTVTNSGKEAVTILRAASVGIDLPSAEYDLVHHHGHWSRECQVVRRNVDHGIQGFQSLTGYSSAYYNPFLALTQPTTTETTGNVWGFNLVYSGSFSAEVEKSQLGFTRVLLGLNPLHLHWPLAPGETFTTPECVSVFSSSGLGGMTRTFHRLYRQHLSRSRFTMEPRPALLNHFEATHFEFNEDTLYPIAHKAAEMGFKLFVMDDGWFGDKYPRVTDNAGLGDWVANPRRFQRGLAPFAEKITALPIAGSQTDNVNFGIWVEPEMVNPQSELYKQHPEWALHAADHDRTEARHQLVLNLGLTVVQDYLIEAIDTLLKSANISYVKWDNNRGIHELSRPSDAHRYILGLYRVIDVLTTRHPDVLWEGCASGGGRFDAGLLHYWPQHWTSDNTDGRDRLYIQWGTSLVYPASTMGCHVSEVPSQQADRTTPFEFRAHVAMMGGGFGFELDINKLSEEEQALIPGIIKLSEEIAPLIVQGDMYRLASPWDSNWPAVQFISEDGREAVVFLYQIRDGLMRDEREPTRLHGLVPGAEYDVNGEVYTGAELMNVGITENLIGGDYRSRVFRIRRSV